MDGSLQQVFEHEYECKVAGERFDQRGQFAQTALRTRRLQRVPERFGIIADQPRHLRQPSGGAPTQQFHKPARTRATHQALDRLEHGHVGLAWPVLLDASAARDSTACVGV